MIFDINVIKGNSCNMRGYRIEADTQLEAEEKALKKHGDGSRIISVYEIIEKVKK